MGTTMRYQNKRIAYFDLETTAIPSTGVYDVEAIHCIGVKINDEPTQMFTSRYLPIPNYAGTLRNALDLLNSCDYIVGHNIQGFDCIVVEQLLGSLTPSRLDTLLLAKLLYTQDQLLDHDIGTISKENYGSYSLDAFGERLGNHKHSFSDWSRLTSQMCAYCTQDVEVTYSLFQHLITHEHYPSQSIIDLENEVASIIAQQQYLGFYYDIDAGRQLMAKLMHEQLTIELRLARTFKPKFLPDGNPITPAKPRMNRSYVLDESYIGLTAIAYHPHQYTTLKNGKIRFKKYRWFDRPHRLVMIATEGEYQKIKLTKFNPGSRTHIIKWLKAMYDFEFSTYTEIGNPKVEGEELAHIPEAKDLMRYLKVTKDISEVRGILDIVHPDSHSVHGRVDTIGAATHRCTHSNPNVAQTSADPAFRSLYTVPEGYHLVGADLANIEVRVLAHYLYQYDGGAYAQAVLSKDMHWYHAKLAGFWNIDDRDWDEHTATPEMKAARSLSKGFFFGYLYGQGDTIRGHTLWKDGCLTDYTQEEYNLAKERIEKRLNSSGLFPLKKDKYVQYDESLILKTIYGKRIADTFLDRMVGIKELIADVSSQSKTTGYVQAIDGRYLFSRSPHSALNLLLQGSAGIIAKQWMVNYHHLAKEKGLQLGTDYWQSAYVHDEYQCPCLPHLADTLGECLEAGASKVTFDFNMNIPIRANYSVGQTWADTH